MPTFWAPLDSSYITVDSSPHPNLSHPPLHIHLLVHNGGHPGMSKEFVRIGTGFGVYAQSAKMRKLISRVAVDKDMAWK